MSFVLLSRSSRDGSSWIFCIEIVSGMAIHDEDTNRSASKNKIKLPLQPTGCAHKTVGMDYPSSSAVDYFSTGKLPLKFGICQ